ncbi:hypothetical protein [Natrinema soli]|uniref:Ribbon-helix-helix protein CopG domain-containing protein n=1 Tax=Natrinema soli TaxID=1930624 RepID=A0ABD5SI27_9EURY|nr:hypothetical protein [Natrinema soli]
MKTVTTRVDSDTHDEIEARADESDMSKSAVARELIQQGLEYDDLENERDRLQRQLTATNKRQDEVTELVEYVEREKSLSERKAQAGIVTRAKWLITGMPTEGAE